MAAFGGGNPFASGGNPFAGGGLKGGMGMLKKKAVPKRFVELEICTNRKVQWKKSATARMREIDTYRLHVPEPNERKRFLIPESTERMNLTDQKHLMVLCGGYAGVRFSTEDLEFIMKTTKKLSEEFESLDSYFKSLPNAVKRTGLSEDLIASIESSSEVSEMKTEEKTEEMTPDQELIIKFHNLGDAVHIVLMQFQDFVKRKQDEFSNMPESSPDDILSQDGDGEESLSSKPRPVWLETLLCKYTHEVTDMPLVKDSLPPVGSLCAFLSCCAIRQVSMTKAEEEALLELIQASCDFAASSAGNLPHNIDDEIFSHTQKYWAQRFFVFMKKLTELKTAVKDEKSLFLFDKFVL